MCTIQFGVDTREYHTLIEENCDYVRNHVLYHREHAPPQSEGGDGPIAAGEPPRVVLVAEHELFTVEEKRAELQMKRFTVLEACRKVWGAKAR